MGNLFCLAHYCNWFEDFILFLFQIDSSQIWGFHEFSFLHNIDSKILSCWTALFEFFFLAHLVSVLYVWLLSYEWSDIFYCIFSFLWFEFWIPVSTKFPKISWNLEQAVLLESNDSLAMFVNQILQFRDQLKTNSCPYTFYPELELIQILAFYFQSYQI